MTPLAHIPVLRRGKAYESLDKAQIVDHRTGTTLTSNSQVNAGIIRKGLGRVSESRAALKKFSTEQLLDICAKAGEQFLNGTLPLGDKGHTQSPRQYIETLSSTSGLPHSMVRRNMAKINDCLRRKPYMQSDAGQFSQGELLISRVPAIVNVNRKIRA
jgi:hypothetical protein